MAVTSHRSAAVCVGLAAAAHAVLFIGGPRPHHGSTGMGLGAVSARYVVESPLAPPAAGESPTAEPPSPTPDPAPARAEPPERVQASGSSAAPGDGEAPDAQAPAFEPAASPQLSFPDAPVPASGARVRVYVALAADGSPQLVSTAPEPGAVDAGPAFQKAAQRELQDARFKAGRGSAYCLLASFELGQPAPRLAWLPGAARDAARCLTGVAPPPRDLPAGAGP